MAERRGSGLQILPHGFKSRSDLHLYFKPLTHFPTGTRLTNPTTNLNNVAMNTLAIDIGATKIALALCDGSFNLTHRKQISSQHEPTVESDPNDSLWESLKRELISYTDQPINGSTILA